MITYTASLENYKENKMIRRKINKLNSNIMTFESRINHLEKLLKTRKFESTNLQTMCQQAFRMLQAQGSRIGIEVLGFDTVGDHFEIDIQDDMDGQEYYDDWECDYEVFGLYPNDDGTVNVQLISSNFNNPTDLDVCSTANEIVQTILDYRVSD